MTDEQIKYRAIGYLSFVKSKKTENSECLGTTTINGMRMYDMPPMNNVDVRSSKVMYVSGEKLWFN